MDIIYKTKKLEKQCTDYRVTIKDYNKEMAAKITQRIDEIHSALTVSELVQFKIGRCHPLEGNRNGQYAMDLVHPFRLVFVENKGHIELVKIIAIEDYH